MTDQPETYTLAEAEYEVRSYAAGLSGALAPGREITRLLAEYDRLRAENVELRQMLIDERNIRATPRNSW